MISQMSFLFLQVNGSARTWPCVASRWDWAFSSGDINSVVDCATAKPTNLSYFTWGFKPGSAVDETNCFISRCLTRVAKRSSVCVMHGAIIKYFYVCKGTDEQLRQLHSFSDWKSCSLQQWCFEVQV